MKNIKFRAWNRLTKEMINVYVLDQTGKAGTGANANESKGYNDTGQKTFYLHDVELMQYTGLKDKNGKEIYEGDIICALHFVSSKGVQEYLYHEVKWDIDYTGWKCVSINNAEGESITAHGNPQLWVYIKNEGSSEVIGNIYENPELIK